MRKQYAKESALHKNNFTIYEESGEKKKQKGKSKRLFRKEQN